MIYQVLGICKDCKRSKCCINASRGLACNRYKSIKAEKLKKRKAEMLRISQNLKGEKEND